MAALADTDVLHVHVSGGDRRRPEPDRKSRGVVHIEPVVSGAGIVLRKTRGMKPLRIAVQQYLPELRYWQLQAQHAARQLAIAKEKCKRIGARMRAVQQGVRNAPPQERDTTATGEAALLPNAKQAGGTLAASEPGKAQGDRSGDRSTEGRREA